jgi:thiol-disulfide isomerase/thioredoxin
MTRTLVWVVASIAVCSGLLVADEAEKKGPQPANLRRDGAFAFPQSQAKVLCDNSDLRVSVWNDAKYLYVQAVVWADGDDSLGETDDGRPIGDTACLCLAYADQKPTPKVDRNYWLNPWPRLPGLHYAVVISGSSTTSLKGDSKGRGAIRYLSASKGKTVRVDSLVIPLAEIGKKPGEKIRLAYWGSSPKPKLTLDSVGYKATGSYYAHSLPRKLYHEITLEDRAASLAIARVPEGRQDRIPLAKKARKAIPKIGVAPPEVAAKDWLHIDKAPTLAGLKGKVVVVEFWATWCGPCVAGIPHLNKLHDEYASKGLTILSFTDQSRKGIENFLKKMPIKYALGTGSELASEYGVSGIPHAFLIGKDGKLLWEGNPADTDFDQRIVAALKAK